MPAVQIINGAAHASPLTKSSIRQASAAMHQMKVPMKNTRCKSTWAGFGPGFRLLGSRIGANLMPLPYKTLRPIIKLVGDFCATA